MKIYYLDSTKLTDEQIKGIYLNSEPYRQIKYNETENKLSKRECIATDALIKRSVREYLPDFKGKPETEYLPTGKLSFSNLDLHLCVSHTQGHVFVGICSYNFGLDAELVREINYTALSKRYFKGIKNEISSLLEFYKEWTALEARFKNSNTDHIDFSSTAYKVPVICTVYNDIVISIASQELTRDAAIEINEINAEEL